MADLQAHQAYARRRAGERRVGQLALLFGIFALVTFGGVVAWVLLSEPTTTSDWKIPTVQPGSANKIEPESPAPRSATDTSGAEAYDLLDPDKIDPQGRVEDLLKGDEPPLPSAPSAVSTETLPPAQTRRTTSDTTTLLDDENITLQPPPTDEPPATLPPAPALEPSPDAQALDDARAGRGTPAPAATPSTSEPNRTPEDTVRATVLNGQEAEPGWYAQLGSVRVRAALPAMWRRFRARDRAAAPDAELPGWRAQEADLGERGVFHRFLVGPFADEQKTRALCVRLQQRNEDCLVRRVQ